MIKKHKASYKPLLFTTTMRNPERIKPFLRVLKEFDGQVLTNDLIESIFIKLFQLGLYRPMKGRDAVKAKWDAEIELSHAEAKQLYDLNPQSHKEAGFDKGWPSRFQTSFSFMKELGFVNYAINERVVFSETGNLLIADDSSNEQIAFANAFAKYQSGNPFRRVSNDNIPLILLLQTVVLLKENNPDSAGISRRELPLLICWPDNNAKALRDKILKIRAKYKFTPSPEVIMAECDELINDTKRDPKSILVDYPDEFIRKMKLTGFITIRGGGRFIDMNNNEREAIQHILDNYANYKRYEDESAYYAYMSSLDHKLQAILTKTTHVIKSTRKDLQKWVSHYNWGKIKEELLKLATNGVSTDEILKFIDRPLRLEFLVSLAIISNIDNIDVIPNYIVDDEGLPSSHAPGNNADIECKEPDSSALIEVTLLSGTAQHKNESFSVTRHLDEYIKKGNPNTYALFIAPKVFIDTSRCFRNMKLEEGLDIRSMDLTDFVTALEQHNTLRGAAFS